MKILKFFRINRWVEYLFVNFDNNGISSLVGLVITSDFAWLVGDLQAPTVSTNLAAAVIAVPYSGVWCLTSGISAHEGRVRCSVVGKFHCDNKKSRKKLPTERICFFSGEDARWKGQSGV